MRIRQLLIIPIVLVALLGATGAALAGGWASVTMAQPSGDVSAGETATLELTVLQHGETPVGWPRLTVVATNAETGAVVRSEALARSAEKGLYTVELVLPTAGTWTFAYESPDLIMDGSATLDVAVPAVAAGAAAAAGAPTSPDSGIVRVVFGAILLVSIGMFGLLIRNRRGDRAGRRLGSAEPREQPLASG